MRFAFCMLVRLLTGVSVLLCVGTLALWARSYRAQDEFMYSWAIHARHLYDVTLTYCPGRIIVGAGVWRFSDAERPDYVARNGKFESRLWRETHVFAGPADPRYTWCKEWAAARWFDVSVDRRPLNASIVPGSVHWSLWAPHGVVAGAFACLPVARLYRWGRFRRRRRLAGRICASCGYDLRATPERCPECGTPVRGLGELSIG